MDLDLSSWLWAGTLIFGMPGLMLASVRLIERRPHLGQRALSLHPGTPAGPRS